MAHQIHKLHVKGMHCNACVLLTECELADHPKVASAKSNLKNGMVEIEGDFGEMTLEEIAQELTTLLSEHSLSVEQQKKEVRWREFAIAVPVAISFLALFALLQKLGVVNLVNSENFNYGTAFLIGIVASLSSCMAIVGGLLLSMSATFAKEGDKVRPQILFHAGRIVAFFLLGGVIGALGSAFQLGIMGTFVMGMIVGLVMLVMGINLLDIFHFTKRLIPGMPKNFAKRALSITKMNHTLTPALVGIATFFLPCGFTQSMQLYSLSTGSFLQGALTMLAFALGTLPVLSMISFSSMATTTSTKSGIFFKSAGLIVIMFAVFNIINSLVTIGVIAPVFNF